jgi:hypothetical protein
MSANETAERWLQESESPFAGGEGEQDPRAAAAEEAWTMPQESSATGAWGEGMAWTSEAYEGDQESGQGPWASELFEDPGAPGEGQWEQYEPASGRGELFGEGEAWPTASEQEWAGEAETGYGGQAQEDLLGELLDEETVTTHAGWVPAAAFAGEEPPQVVPEEFTGAEHKAIGDAGAGGAASSIPYGDPPRLLTFGDVVALAGDYFGTYDELLDLGRTRPGRLRIEWARWHCLELAKASEPRVPEEVKKAVVDRYLQLAAQNQSHFSAGGTAWQTYSVWHAKAVASAFEAGQGGDANLWRRALTKEAFGDHFLTDSFSAGHVRMPRTAIQEWYGRQFPGKSDPFIRYMARFMYRRLDAQGKLPWLLEVFENMTQSMMAQRIRELGGEALASFTLGDIVGLALHAHDNRGLVVVSDVDANGRPVPGGFVWTAVGDAHLAKSPQGPGTRAMAQAAVAVSLGDLRRVRDAGAKVGKRPLSLAQRTDVVRKALGSPIFAARRYVPRERVGDRRNLSMTSTAAGRAPLDWHWGQLGPAAYKAVNDTVKGQIVSELTRLVPSVKDSVTRYHMTVNGVRGAFQAFIDHLRSDGIKAIENAVGKRAS